MTRRDGGYVAYTGMGMAQKVVEVGVDYPCCGKCFSIGVFY